MNEAFPNINYSERHPKTNLLEAIRIVRENLNTVISAPFEIVLNDDSPFTIDSLRAMGQLPIECLILKDSETGNMVLNTGNEYSGFPELDREGSVHSEKVLSRRLFSGKTEFSLHNHPEDSSLPSRHDIQTYSEINSPLVNFIINKDSVSLVVMDKETLYSIVNDEASSNLGTLITISFDDTKKMTPIISFLNEEMDSFNLLSSLLGFNEQSGLGATMTDVHDTQESTLLHKV